MAVRKDRNHVCSICGELFNPKVLGAEKSICSKCGDEIDLKVDELKLKGVS